MSKHTKEPWKSAGSLVYQGVNGGFDLSGGPNPEGDALRIVACVNACAGVDTDLLEAGELDKPTMLVIQENKDLKHRCNELLVALEWSDSQIMEFISIAFRHAEIKGDFEISDVRDALKVISSKAKGGAS